MLFIINSLPNISKIAIITYILDNYLNNYSLLTMFNSTKQTNALLNTS